MSLEAGRGRASLAVLRTGALSMVALVALGLTRLIHGSLISHTTDRATYGLVGTLLGTTMIASLVFPGGLSSAAAKYLAMYRGAGRPATAVAAHRMLSRLSVASAVLLGLGAALAARALFAITWWDAGAVALLTAAYSGYSVEKAALYGFGRTVRYARLEVMTSVLAIATTVVIVVSGWDGYLVPLIVGYGVFVLGARHILRPDLRVSDAGTGFGQATDFDRKDVISYSVIASAGTLSSAGFLQATQLLAYGFDTAAGAAYFAASVALVAPLYFLPRALGLALFPAMAKAHGAGDQNAIRAHADRFTRTLVVLLAPLLAAALFLAPVVLTAFGGRSLAGGSEVFRIMLVATYLGVIQVPAVNALASGSGRRAWIPSISAVVGCATGLAVVAVLGRSLGTTGVALGYLAGVAIISGAPMVVIWRSWRLPWGGPLARSLLVVGLAAGVASLLDASGVGRGLLAATAASLISLVVLLSDLKALPIPGVTRLRNHLGRR